MAMERVGGWRRASWLEPRISPFFTPVLAVSIHSFAWNHCRHSSSHRMPHDDMPKRGTLFSGPRNPLASTAMLCGGNRVPLTTTTLLGGRRFLSAPHRRNAAHCELEAFFTCSRRESRFDSTAALHVASRLLQVEWGSIFGTSRTKKLTAPFCLGKGGLAKSTSPFFIGGRKAEGKRHWAGAMIYVPAALRLPCQDSRGTE